MFGDNDYEEWADFLQEYSPPPYSLPGHTPALSFGVAGPGSGVPFHTHGYNTILLLLTVLAINTEPAGIRYIYTGRASRRLSTVGSDGS